MKWRIQFFSRSRRYDDLSTSIQEHIEERTEELMEDGMPRKEAEQRARREFGNVTLIAERSREVWQWSWLESLLADLRLILRRLAKVPGFTVTILLTLAIGIGANIAVFSVINRVLLEPLPYPHPQQLVTMRLNAPGAGGLADFSNGLQLSPSMYLTFSTHNRTFQSMGIWYPGTANVTGVARPEQVLTAVVSDGILQTLDVAPVVGRWLSQADQEPRAGKTVMLSYAYWQRRFGGERNVIGRTVQVDSQPREIVGVMPRGFRMTDQDFDLLLPMAVDPLNQKLAPFCCDGIGRLKPGVSLAQADADIARLIPVWMDSWTNGPGTDPHYYTIWHIAPDFRPLKQRVIGNVSSMLWVVMATVGLVMLIACTNVANLVLVRAESRQHELAIRAALGAGRRRIASQLLLESAVLGLAGGAAAVGVAWAGLRLLVAAGPKNLPRLSEIALDAHSLIFAMLVSVLASLFFGAIPVWKYARRSSTLTIAGNSRTATTGRMRRHSRSLLVIAQTAMAFVLLICAVLMIRTFAALRNVEPGFSDPAQVQTMRTTIPYQLIHDPQLVTRTQNAIEEKIAAVPGVTSVAFAAGVPMDGIAPNWDLIFIDGKDYAGGQPPLRFYNYVSPGYFHVMGTRLVAGRDFTWTDVYGLRPMVIVSENFARESWGSASAAIGKRVRRWPSAPWQKVIGVVEDVRQNGVDQSAPAIMYWPAMGGDPTATTPTLYAPRSSTFVVRSSRAGDQNFIRALQQAVWAVNPDVPLAMVQTMQQISSRSMARTSFTLAMLAIAGCMALALSIIGIYGVMSYAVAQRTREMGIRLALGAQRNALRWMFVRSAMALAGNGMAVGFIAAILLTQWMRSLLFGISPWDPLTFLTVPLILTAAALLGSYVPARRASSVDPVDTLRAE